MIFDSPQQKQFAIHIFNQMTFPASDLDFAFMFKQQLAHAQVIPPKEPAIKRPIKITKTVEAPTHPSDTGAVQDH